MEKDINDSLIFICENHLFHYFRNKIHLKELDLLKNLTSFLNEFYCDIPITQRMWHVKNNFYSLQTCMCGKPKKFDKEYKMCHKCSTSMIVSKKLLEKSELEKELSIKKRKKRCLELYGVENPMQSDDVKKKIIDTNIKRYGVENVSQNEKIQEKNKNSNILSYKHNKNSIISKRNITCVERYGVENPMQSDDVKKTHLKSCVEKYGVENPMQNKLISKKQVFSRIISSVYDNAKLKYSSKDIKYVRYEGDQRHLLFCLRCKNEFIHITSSNYRINNNLDICPICNPINNNISFLELQLLNFIKSFYNGKIISNCNSVISPYELDIYLPDLKLAFEFNGDYWHANPSLERFKDDNSFHSFHGNILRTNGDIRKKDENKKMMCEKINVRLIHIFENDWKTRNSEIKSEISDLISEDISDIFD